MTDKQIIIKDCQYFIGGCCQEYLDGVCENHKCDLKIIRELEEKLSNKRKECDELHETVKSQKEEIKNLNYTLYEERNLTTDLAKANLKISTLKRDLSSARNRFKNENQQNKEIIKAKEQECEELKKDVIEALKLVEITSTHNTFQETKINRLSKTLTEIKEICNNNDELKGDFNLVDCDKYKLGKHNLANKILQKISEVVDET